MEELGDGLEMEPVKAYLRYKKQIERSLAEQIYSLVLGRDYQLYRVTGSRKLYAYGSPEQAVEIELMYDLHRRNMNDQLDMFYHGYCIANNLLLEATEDSPEPTPEQREAAMKASMMAQGINKTTHRKRIEG